jgi:glycosyltransferase XagB
MNGNLIFRQPKKVKRISVVIPVYNELVNVKKLNKLLIKTLTNARLAFELIYIDDNSTDGTYEYLTGLNRNSNFPVYVYRKLGRKGKAFSLIEGFGYATGNILAMIDADLQYPASVLPRMIAMINHTTDIVIANRIEQETTISRKIASKGFRLFFGRILFGLKTDVQSGLKVFKRGVFETAKYTPRTPWTFDLEFLYRAVNIGYQIKNFNIVFKSRLNGNSKIHFINQILEIGGNALLLRVRKLSPMTIPPINERNMIGAGIVYKRNKYITHSTLAHTNSAIVTFSLLQKFIIGLVFLLLIAGFIIRPLITLQVIVTLVSIIYFIDVCFQLLVIIRSLSSNRELKINDYEIHSIDNRSLPVYSILCPLYKEAAVLPQFLDAIEKLDWPKNKLDVLLLLEKDDLDTLEKVKNIKLPKYVRTVIVPSGIPKTKPKACNYGLNLARGEYVVIYDAEDIPDSLQLKKAYLGFQKSDPQTICLQAKLNYYNPSQNLLTRLFTTEYSLWFGLTMPGLQSLNTSLPLGGTSNHFKTDLLKKLRGWDTFNVTEDADLGLRLFKQGYRTSMIDSETLEEANSSIPNWVRQRSRWIKGYMQSYLVHNRDIVKFAADKGIHAILMQLTVGAKLTFILLNPILWITTLSYFLFYRYTGAIIEDIYVLPAFYLGVISLVFGNFLFFYYYMIGAAKNKQYDLIKYVFLIPAYWVLISIAGFIAFFQLIFKPYYWEKTVHGLHLKKTKSFNIAGITIEFGKAKLRLPLTFPVLQRLFNRIVIGNKEPQQSAFGNRILIFNWRDTKHIWAGGAETYIHQIAKHLVTAGNQVTVFCGNDNWNSVSETIDGVNIIRRGGHYTVYIYAIIYYLIMFRGKFDIIIDSENGIPFFTPLFVRKPKLLLIHHIHQEVFRSYLHFPLKQIALFLEAQAMPFVYRNQNIITVSESTRKQIINMGLFLEDNITVINPGLDSVYFTKAIKTKNPSLIYLGRLKPYKNIDTIIYALPQVLAKFPKAKLSIVGTGESVDSLKQLVHKLNLKQSVSFLGYVNEERKINLLSQSWAMLQPSLVEGWGITVIEANACGTPVIASKVNGLVDSVKDGITGMLIDSKNINIWSESVKKLIGNESLRNELGRKAYDWSKNFSWINSSQLFNSLIKSTLAKQSRQQIVPANVAIEGSETI